MTKMLASDWLSNTRIPHQKDSALPKSSKDQLKHCFIILSQCHTPSTILSHSQTQCVVLSLYQSLLGKQLFLFVSTGFCTRLHKVAS